MSPTKTQIIIPTIIHNQGTTKALMPIAFAIKLPVEEFVPVGYDDAKAGETFLKIGVGMLLKPEEEKYFFGTPYKITNGGTWKVKKKNDQVLFTHILNDDKFSYEYHKSVQLVKEKPEMVLTHSLKNTGKQILETSAYDHNFFMLDNQSDLITQLPSPLHSQVKHP